MEQKNKITCLQKLFDWINSSDICVVTETGDNYFIVEAPNNADVYVRYDEDDEIDTIISKAISQLQNFDADERFEELWEPSFVAQNHFKPSQFIKMLQEDEETFRELAENLEDIWHEE